MMRRLSSVVLAALLLACQQSPTIPKLEEQPVPLSMTFSATTFRLGKADTIRVTATNTLDQSVRIFFSSDCQIVVTIRNEAGAVVVPAAGRPLCIGIASTLIIPANGSVTQRFIWNGAREFIPPGSATPLPTGTYFISAAMEGTNYSTFLPAFKVELVGAS